MKLSELQFKRMTPVNKQNVKASQLPARSDCKQVYWLLDDCSITFDRTTKIFTGMWRSDAGDDNEMSMDDDSVLNIIEQEKLLFA